MERYLFRVLYVGISFVLSFVCGQIFFSRLYRKDRNYQTELKKGNRDIFLTKAGGISYLAGGIFSVVMYALLMVLFRAMCWDGHISYLDDIGFVMSAGWLAGVIFFGQRTKQASGYGREGSSDQQSEGSAQE